MNDLARPSRYIFGPETPIGGAQAFVRVGNRASLIAGCISGPLHVFARVLFVSPKTTSALVLTNAASLEN